MYARWEELPREYTPPIQKRRVPLFIFPYIFCYTIPAFPYSLFPILSRAPLFLNSEASCSELCVVVQKPRRGPSRASPPHLSCFPGPAGWRGGIRPTRKFPKSVIHLFRRENRLSVSTIPPYVLSLSAHQSIFSFANFCDEANRRLSPPSSSSSAAAFGMSLALGFGLGVQLSKLSPSLPPFPDRGELERGLPQPFTVAFLSFAYFGLLSNGHRVKDAVVNSEK